jgi:iron (metal) dependent repressor, dtxR family protein
MRSVWTASPDATPSRPSSAASGEPIQADAELLAGLEDAQIVAGAEVELRVSAGGVRLVGSSGDPVVLADDVARHLFVRR